MKNYKSIGMHRLIILPVLFFLAISAIFMFHTIVVEQQRLKNIKQSLEDIRSDAYRIAGQDKFSQKSYEIGRLAAQIKKLKNIKEDSQFYSIISAENINLLNTAENFLATITPSSPAELTESIPNMIKTLDEAISSTIQNLDEIPRTSIRNKVKIEYSLILLICIFILLQYYVADSYMKRRLKKQEIEHEESKELIKKLTERDSLTNLPGRKKFYEEADREIASATRYSSDLALIKMDIHNFKEINKKHGQQVGDKILSRFARIVRKNLRRPDSFFRVGGDKFIILAPHTTIENAQNLSKKINLLVKKDKMTSSIQLEINFGIAPCDKKDTSESLMKKVASALKSSKIQGAGKIAIFGHSTLQS